VDKGSISVVETEGAGKTKRRNQGERGEPERGETKVATSPCKKPLSPLRRSRAIYETHDETGESGGRPNKSFRLVLLMDPAGGNCKSGHLDKCYKGKGGGIWV